MINNITFMLNLIFNLQIMKSIKICNKFLNFFKSKGHTIVPSSSLIPDNDSSLLFTNSGMVQFKDVFLGIEKRNYLRATSVQRCLRAGGKHNDLENVGYTNYHHTFFQMLGNWSFGDYFKYESLQWAWELLTQIYGLSIEKLWITVYITDDETYNIWTNKIGVLKERVIRIGDKKNSPLYTSDNFWQMSDNGPCGPCSEIFYDCGPEFHGNPPGNKENFGDRYIEIWNNVFMQFNREINPKTGSIKLTPLPKYCVDTGMGLERLASILQNVHNNYETDLFKTLIKAAARETNCNNLKNNSLKVIADHIRACVFLIIDGVFPGNDGRSYVLRRIIRRAIRHGYKLGQNSIFFYKLVKDLIFKTYIVYPELKISIIKIEEILRKEEERFRRTLKYGIKILEGILLKKPNKLDGKIAFMLYDTYGFPIDLTIDICKEYNVYLDKNDFILNMEKQRSSARLSSKFKDIRLNDYYILDQKTKFVGYKLETCTSKIIGLYIDTDLVQTININQEALVILDSTPFYAESGGQAGDIGTIKNDFALFVVNNTKKIKKNIICHYGILKYGVLNINNNVVASIDISYRKKITRNHSATHLLNRALREVFGEDIIQKGSFINSKKIRFDFNCNTPIHYQNIQKIEKIVNKEILENTSTEIKLMSFNNAINFGAIRLFNKKYGKKVRVVSIGRSIELCGGTHVKYTGDIGLFKIVSENGVSSGIRRIEAVTGDRALLIMQKLSNIFHEITIELKLPPEELKKYIIDMKNNIKLFESELYNFRFQFMLNKIKNLLPNVININGIKVLISTLDNVDNLPIHKIVHELKNKLKYTIFFFVTIKEKKINLFASVTSDLVNKIKANELINFIIKQIGGKGGGNSNTAQGIGNKNKNFKYITKNVINWIKKTI
ncbi:alanine--tRNA ligase [Candidatus Profftella armatura (Diaphorina cf. continua)]|uniref:Alanine--tRNA ligase n=2 Tax=Candidatus Profftella armatura (Diaphorina cf. continua) TaxID=2661583 RepID=A0A7R7AB37_9PROT|nr:alanine--tRNA ligase [Candidatus Profftella armatura (Diaphorina cf. continua)]BCG49730.1 alanine--tRNA ligase [Candidatus Profftella armatura (Diaphorina cf. continua)]